MNTGRRGQRIRQAAVLALLALVACGSDGETTSSAKPAGSSDANGEVPRTIVSLDDLDKSGSEIATLLSYYEGGDNPCGSIPEDTVLDEPLIVDTAFRDSPEMQIGWQYTLCWAWDGVDSFELRDPEGKVVAENDDPWPSPLLPGSPIGTYTAVASYQGKRLVAEVEVVPATEPRLLVDPEVERMADPCVADEFRAFLVGFGDVDEVTVAFYERRADDAPWPEPEAGLIGTARVPVGADGSAALTVRPSSDGRTESIWVVADPVQASKRWGVDEPAVDGLLSLEFNQQLATQACFDGA